MPKTKLLAQTVLADRLGITPRHVRRLVLDGLPKTGEGPTAKHPWPASRVWYNEYLEAKERKRQPADDLAYLRARKLEADTLLAEIEVGKADGSLIPFEMHEAKLGAICDRLRAALLTVPSAYLDRIKVTRSDLDARAVAEQVRNELLRALEGVSGEGDNDSD